MLTKAEMAAVEKRSTVAATRRAKTNRVIAKKGFDGFLKARAVTKAQKGYVQCKRDACYKPRHWFTPANLQAHLVLAYQGGITALGEEKAKGDKADPQKVALLVRRIESHRR